MTELVFIVSDNTISVSSINGNQHLYGKIASTPKRDDGLLSSSFLLHKHSPYRETPIPKYVYRTTWKLTYSDIAMFSLYEMWEYLNEGP